jgi:hypothetical protein
MLKRAHGGRSVGTLEKGRTMKARNILAAVVVLSMVATVSA